MIASLFSRPESCPPVILRPYQEQMVSAWQAFLDGGGQRGLIVAATGTGKTTVFSAIVGAGCAADASQTALILAHSRELLHQSAERLFAMHPWLSVAIDAAELRAERGTRVVVGSVQTLGQAGSDRVGWLGPNLVICDEGHHAAAPTYQAVFRRFGCYDEGGAALLGVTATPHRLDNLALVGSRDRAIFESVVFRYDIVAAIKDGFLVELRGYRAAADMDLSSVRTSRGDYVEADLERVVNVDRVTELAFDSWSKVASDRPSIVFCAGVDHAVDVAEAFRAKGVTAEAVFGEMPQAEREAVVARFRDGRTQVVTNCNILTEGFDAQHCGCIVLLRPTQSWSLFTQMVGRGLRTLPGVIEGIGEPAQRRVAIRGSAKPDCVVIDIVSATERHSVASVPGAKEKPSLQALVGLPAGLDLEGRSLADAVAEFDLLPEAVKAAAFRRRMSFSGLSAVLTQVEMLAELDVPEEAGSAQLYWLKVGDLEYEVNCGGDDRIVRTSRLSSDLLGNWTLHLKSVERATRQVIRDQAFELSSCGVADAFMRSENVIRNQFPGVMRLAGRDAPWRKGAPTDRQLEMLRRAGVHEEVLATLDKGKASAMISMLKAGALEVDRVG